MQTLRRNTLVGLRIKVSLSFPYQMEDRNWKAKYALGIECFGKMSAVSCTVYNGKVIEWSCFGKSGCPALIYDHSVS